MPETFESNMVNFEFWLNLTGNLTKNRNYLKLNCKKQFSHIKMLNFLQFNFKRLPFLVKFPVKFNQNSKLTRFDAKVSDTACLSYLHCMQIKANN